MVHTKTYIVTYFYWKYLVLFTMVHTKTYVVTYLYRVLFTMVPRNTIYQVGFCVYHRVLLTMVPRNINSFRTAVSFWGQSNQILNSLSPKRDCGTKSVKVLSTGVAHSTPVPLHLSTCSRARLQHDTTAVVFPSGTWPPARHGGVSLCSFLSHSVLQILHYWCCAVLYLVYTRKKKVSTRLFPQTTIFVVCAP